MNRQGQISKAPKFIAYLDTSNFEYIPEEGMIKKECGYGMGPVYYIELKANNIVDAMSEAYKYKDHNVYLVDILKKLPECDEYGYVLYDHFLRCRSNGFYPIGMKVDLNGLLVTTLSLGA